MTGRVDRGVRAVPVVPRPVVRAVGSDHGAVAHHIAGGKAAGEVHRHVEPAALSHRQQAQIPHQRVAHERRCRQRLLRVGLAAAPLSPVIAELGRGRVGDPDVGRRVPLVPVVDEELHPAVRHGDGVKDPLVQLQVNARRTHVGVLVLPDVVVRVDVALSRDLDPVVKHGADRDLRVQKEAKV